MLMFLQMGFCKTKWHDCFGKSCCSKTNKLTQPKVLISISHLLFFVKVEDIEVLVFFSLNPSAFLSVVSRLENHGLDPNVEIVPK